MTSTRSRRRRAAWTFVGQGLSSSSNFLVVLWALTSMPAAGFAALSLCITTFLLVAQLGRAVVSTPVLVLYSDESGTAVPAGAEAATGAAVASGLMAGTIMAAGAVALGGAGGVELGPFLVLAAALPFLLYQDTLRHVCIARHRPSLAAASDGSWLVLQIAGFALLSLGGRPSAAQGIAVWAAAGATAGLWLGAVLGVRPRIARAAGWIGQHRVLCRRLLGEFAANSGSYYVVAYGIAVLAGVGQLGHLRAAQALFGPASVVLLGGTVLGVPESVRARADRAQLVRFASHLSGWLALASVAAAGLLAALAPSLERGLFDGSVGRLRPLLLLLGLFGAGIGVSTGPLAGLRACRADGWIVRAQALRGGAAVLVGLPGAALAGAAGGLFGLALAEAGFALAAWNRFLRDVAEPASVASSRVTPRPPPATGPVVEAGMFSQ